MLKAELHCHIEGAAPVDLVRAQASRYGVDVSDIAGDDGFIWQDFTQFLSVYDRVAALFRTRDDYRQLAEAHLRGLAAQDCIYAEFFISTDHAERTGLPALDYVNGLAEGIARAKAATGIEARMIATGLRHEGPKAVERAARWIALNPHPLVTGFGMAGDERMHHPADFTAAFDIARKEGLGITVHAGELAGADSVRQCLDNLRPSRIGHGVRAIEDPELVRRLAREGVVLEVCPVSNIVLGIFDSFADHPLAWLAAQGVSVTLNSDDPPHFHTSLAREYEVAADECGLDDGALRTMTETAIDAAFVDEATRQTLKARLAGQPVVAQTPGA